MTPPNTLQRFVADMLAQAGALVIDYDGTFADTAAARQTALAHALALHGAQLDPARYQARTGLGISDLLSELPDTAHLDRDAIITASRNHLLARLELIEPIPAVLSLVRLAVKHAIPCAIASGTSGTLVHPGLRALGHTGLFAAVVVREDVAHGKPAPDLYIAAAHALGVPPAHCLTVDDAPQGIEAARRAGMAVLTLRSGRLARAATATDHPAESGHA